MNDTNSNAAAGLQSLHERRRFLRHLAGAAVGGAATLTLAQRPVEAASKNLSRPDETTNVRRFGAKGDGITDDTQSILTAIAAAKDTSKVVYFPPGSYLVSRTITLDTAVTLTGAGSFCTKITTNQATGDVIVVTAQGVEIYNLGFKSSVKRTGGIYVNFTTNGGFGYLGHFFMEGAFVGVNMAGVSCRVDKGSIRDGASGPGSCGIMCTGGDDLHISNVTMDNPTPPWPEAGVHVNVIGALQMTDCDIIRSGKDLYLTQANSVYCSNTFFDTADYGIYIEPKGLVLISHFIGCWTAGNLQSGVMINAPTAAYPNAMLGDIDFIGHHSLYNKGDGLSLEGGNMQVANSNIALNSGAGIRLGATASKCRIINNIIGNTNHFSGNADGIVITEGASGNLITGNIITGNANTQISGATAKNAIHSNLGIDI